MRIFPLRNIYFFIPSLKSTYENVFSYFSVNLSIADAMVSTLNVTFNYTYMLNGDWPFGTLYCKISQFVAILTISASVFTLMAISIDRWVSYFDIYSELFYICIIISMFFVLFMIKIYQNLKSNFPFNYMKYLSIIINYIFMLR